LSLFSFWFQFYFLQGNRSVFGHPKYDSRKAQDKHTAPEMRNVLKSASSTLELRPWLLKAAPCDDDTEMVATNRTLIQIQIYIRHLEVRRGAMTKRPHAAFLTWLGQMRIRFSFRTRYSGSGPQLGNFQQWTAMKSCGW